MKKNNMYYDTHKAKIYKDIYRPSPSPTRFLRTLLSVILLGQSPVGSSSYMPPKKSK